MKLEVVTPEENTGDDNVGDLKPSSWTNGSDMGERRAGAQAVKATGAI